ncbi:MAG: PaaI family thioesterase [Halioglobus sp.]
MSDDKVPADFTELPTGLGFIDAIGPCYRRVEDGAVSFGLFVTDVHANTMGICHGGVLMTLADITATSGVNVARGVRTGSPTINLSLDFISAGRMGEWLQADVVQVTLKRRFGFCNGLISNSDGVVARFNGTFYLPDHEGLWKGDDRGDGIAVGTTNSN